MLSGHQRFETRRIVTAATESSGYGDETGLIVAYATDAGCPAEQK
jgi:hypothetical protein